MLEYYQFFFFSVLILFLIYFIISSIIISNIKYPLLTNSCVQCVQYNIKCRGIGPRSSLAIYIYIYIRTRAQSEDMKSSKEE